MTINPNNKINDNKNSSNEIINVLKRLGKTIYINKGNYILKEGEIADFVFFVEKGCFRTYRWINNEEVTIGFSFVGDIDTCPFAFINQEKSFDFIEALVDSKIIKVQRKDIDILQIPELNNLIQQLLSHYIEVLIQRNIELKIKSAEKIYLDLLKRQPEEVSQIPLMYIASYLGISKERLSRIRKKIK